MPGPSLIDLINVIADRANSIITLITGTMDKYQAGQKEEIRYELHMAWAALSLVFFIVGVAAFLTYKGKIDGSTFTFLLGLVVGYVLTFIRNQISGPE